MEINRNFNKLSWTSTSSHISVFNSLFYDSERQSIYSLLFYYLFYILQLVAMATYSPWQWSLKTLPNAKIMSWQTWSALLSLMWVFSIFCILFYFLFNSMLIYRLRAAQRLKKNLYWPLLQGTTTTVCTPKSTTVCVNVLGVQKILGE